MKCVPIAGTIILTTRPDVYALNTQDLKNCCSCCAVSNLREPLKQCSSCRVIRYCSISCQRSDWELHKSECRCIKKWDLDNPSYSDDGIPRRLVRHIGRIMFKRKIVGSSHPWVRLVILQCGRSLQVRSTSHSGKVSLVYTLSVSDHLLLPTPPYPMKKRDMPQRLYPQYLLSPPKHEFQF